MDGDEPQMRDRSLENEDDESRSPLNHSRKEYISQSSSRRRWGIGVDAVPGHSIRRRPNELKRRRARRRRDFDACGRLQRRGHENPIVLTDPDQEEAILVKCIGLIEQLTGGKPRGYVAPWWELSAATAGLLLKHGFRYDHSMFHNDFTPYYVRVGDRWTKIDYSRHPDTWMKPLQRGTETDLIEMPASWYLDDLPPMMFIKKAPNSHGFVNPRQLEEIWRDQFDWVYREMDYAVFPITIHPDVAGKPQVLLMLERLYQHMSAASGRALHAARRDRGGFRPASAAPEVAQRMCGLCGIFDDGRRWMDAAATLDPAAFRRERLRRVAIIRRVLEPAARQRR